MKLLFTGGYTEDIPMASGEIVPGRCGGIGCYRFEGETGRLDLLSVTPSAPNPSYLTVAPKGPYLYCANELDEADGRASGVSAYAFDPENGQLRLLNQRPAAGPLACYVTLSPGGGHVLAASYGGGIVLYPLDPDRSLCAASCEERFRLPHPGPDPQRQEASHPHQILPHPDGKRVYVSDLGADRLHCFQADWQTGTLRRAPGNDLPANPGQGPRHGVFSKSGNRLYALTELTSEMDVFDPDSGSLLQTVSALPEDFAGPGMGAAVRLHPSGKFLYASLRGPSLIAVFPVHGDGSLDRPAFYPSGGQTPRDFCLTSDGCWLLAAGQDDCSVCVHRIDLQTGALRQVWREENAGSVTAAAVWESGEQE